MNNLRNRSVAAVRFASLWATVLMLLAACGGGGSGVASDPDPSDPNPTSAPPPDLPRRLRPTRPRRLRPTAAMSRESKEDGRQRFSGIFSKINTDGSIVVSDVRFAVPSPTVYVDGSVSSVEDLRIRDVVTVTGTFDSDTSSGCAEAVYSDADLTAQSKR